MKQLYAAGVVILVGALGLVGCGDKPDSKSETVVAGTMPGAATAPNFPLKPYEATLEDGIDFRKQGWPNFLSEVSGLSGYEPWGRWSDALAGPTVKFRFKQALPKKFLLEITGHPFGPNRGQPVKVRVGKFEKTFVMEKTESDSFKLAFETDDAVDTIEITPSKPTSPMEIDPKNGDARKLGIALIILKIKG